MGNGRRVGYDTGEFGSNILIIWRVFLDVMTEYILGLLKLEHLKSIYAFRSEIVGFD